MSARRAAQGEDPLKSAPELYHMYHQLHRLNRDRNNIEHTFLRCSSNDKCEAFTYCQPKKSGGKGTCKLYSSEKNSQPYKGCVGVGSDCKCRSGTRL